MTDPDTAHDGMSSLNEHEQLLAEIAEHPRSEVIHALANAMHSIEDDDGNGRHIDYYRSLAYTTVEILPALFYDEDELCDEPGCGAHPQRAVFTIPADAAEVPDTAGTDPLAAVVSEAIATHSLERGHRGMFSICSCGDRFPLADWPAFDAHQAQAVAAAVRVHQNTTTQKAAAKAPPTDKSWIEMEGG